MSTKTAAVILFTLAMAPGCGLFSSSPAPESPAPQASASAAAPSASVAQAVASAAVPPPVSEPAAGGGDATAPMPAPAEGPAPGNTVAHPTVTSELPQAGAEPAPKPKLLLGDFARKTPAGMYAKVVFTDEGPATGRAPMRTATRFVEKQPIYAAVDVTNPSPKPVLLRVVFDNPNGVKGFYDVKVTGPSGVYRATSPRAVGPVGNYRVAVTGPDGVTLATGTFEIVPRSAPPAVDPPRVAGR